MNDFIWTELQKNVDVFFQFNEDFASCISEIGYVDTKKAYVILNNRFNFLLKKDLIDGLDDDLFNILMHFIAHLDLLSGIDEAQIEADRVQAKLINGNYGIAIKKAYEGLSEIEQGILLNWITFKKEVSDVNFCKAILGMLKKCLIYKIKEGFIVYVDEKENERVKNIIELCAFFLLPVQSKVKIHFKYHIGIISKNETMVLGKIRII